MGEGPLAGRTALVTGASSGLGVDFARQLAARGADLVLVARREDRLHAIAAEIEQAAKVSVRVIPMDLAVPDAPAALRRQLQEAGVAVDVLVNNAGFAYFGQFATTPWEREKSMLDIDIIALTHMTKLFVGDMLARRFGYVLQVASIGAYQPSPTYATYSAAKAYVLSMGEAINHELRGTGVSVTVVSPGVTRTEFLTVAGQAPTRYQRAMMMDSAAVARIAVDAMLRRRSSVVPGRLNSFVAFSMRLLPRRLQVALASASMTRG